MPSLDRPTAPLPYDLLPPTASFTVTSTDVTDGTPMDIKTAHDSAGGQNLSPQLSWSGAPRGHPQLHGELLRPGRADPVRVLALDRGRHPGLGHRAGHRRRLRRRRRCRRAPSTSATTSACASGTAPPRRPATVPHRYVFAVHALDVESLGIDKEATPTFAAFNALFHTLGPGADHPDVPAAVSTTSVTARRTSGSVTGAPSAPTT